MASKGTPKEFDCVKWTREVRDQFYEETKHMTREELRERLSQRPTNPVLARLFDRRKAPQGRNAPDEAVGE